MVIMKTISRLLLTNTINITMGGDIELPVSLFFSACGVSNTDSKKILFVLLLVICINCYMKPQKNKILKSFASGQVTSVKEILISESFTWFNKGQINKRCMCVCSFCCQNMKMAFCIDLFNLEINFGCDQRYAVD